MISPDPDPDVKVKAAQSPEDNQITSNYMSPYPLALLPDKAEGHKERLTAKTLNTLLTGFEVAKETVQGVGGC